jgi:alpha-galactosidase
MSIINFKSGTLTFRTAGKKHKVSFPVDEVTSSPGMMVHARRSECTGGYRVTVELAPEGPAEVTELKLETGHQFNPEETIFCNGFQSWTDSREFRINKRIPRLKKLGRLFKLNCIGEYDIYRLSGKRGRLHGYTYSYIRHTPDELTLIGSISEDCGYTLCEFNAGAGLISITKECLGLELSETRVVLDVIVARGDDEDIFTAYFTLMAGPASMPPLATGWTSWYYHYVNISEDIILENLEAFASRKVPIDIFQIDDGYQTAVGDWLDIKPEFPGGMGRIAKKIHEKGYRAGLWLAPFACDSRSRIFKEKKGWLIRDSRGKPVPGGWIPLWEGTFYGLDIYNPDVVEYLDRVFRTIFQEWNYDMVKLDFLYAAARVPRNGKSRGEIMCDGVKLLRHLAGDRLILGCGVPTGPCYKTFDYCRIGSDVALKWEDRLLKFAGYRERVSTINSLASTIGRRHLNGRAFLNDPDVFILRDEKNSLTRDQKFTLFMLNNIFGGLAFTSDNIANFSDSTMRLYLSMFPLKRKHILSVDQGGDVKIVHFIIDDSRYTCFANLSGRPGTARLEKGHFYNAREEFLKGDRDFDLAPFESRCYLKISGEPFSAAGSTAHLFPGSEIDFIEHDNDHLQVIQDSRMRLNNQIHIVVPSDGSYTVNKKNVRAVRRLDDFYTITIDIEVKP